MSELSQLWLMFSSSFLSATILPGSSEILFLSFINTENANVTALIIIATIGNSLGGFSNYIIGRYFPNKHQSNNSAIKNTLLSRWKHNIAKAMKTRGCRYGPLFLLFSWAPFIGDALCIVAGYLRYNWLYCLIIISIAKFFRYLALASLIYF